MWEELQETKTIYYEATLNQMGYMMTHLDQINHAFINFAVQIDWPSLDIGTAYGHVPLAVACTGVPIYANDMDQSHLDVLWDRATQLNVADKITLLKGKFPHDLNFQPQSLGAISVCRVFHFFSPQEWLHGLNVLFQWLRPGGKLFMTNESPYFGTMREFIPKYLERKRMQHPWPGLMTNMQYFDNDRKKDVNSLINLLSVTQTKSLLLEAGFQVEFIDYLDRKGIYPEDALYDGRESVGVIAVKPD